LEIEDEHKIIINDKANIYLEKLLLPILTAENKNDDLVEEIKNIILYRSNLDKILKVKITIKYLMKRTQNYSVK
jgi:hypothetical protein